MSLPLLLVLLLAPPSDLPAQDPQALRQTMLRQIAGEYAALPLLELAGMGDVASLQVEQGMLRAGARVEAPGGAHRIALPGRDSVMTITLYDVLPHYGDRPFHLVVRDYELRPHAQSLWATLSQAGGRIVLSEDRENALATSSVQLIQDPPPMGDEPPSEPPVRLLIRISDTLTGSTRVDRRIDALSFDALRREHAAEVEQYLRPVIRRLGFESTVFRVEPRIAWQVLGTSEAIDPAVRRRVAALVAELGDPAYARREAARAALEAIGSAAALVLAGGDRAALSPEAASAVDALLADLAPLGEAERSRLADDRAFLLDCLMVEDRDVRALALARLRRVSGAAVEFNLDAPEAARAAAVEALRPRLGAGAPATRSAD